MRGQKSPETRIKPSKNSKQGTGISECEKKYEKSNSPSGALRLHKGYSAAWYEAIGRTGEAAQGAMRAAMEKKIADSMEAGFLRTMGPADAAAKAVLGAKEAMGSLAASHGPDLKAGGSGALTGLGDAGINSSLGAQWSSKVGKMDTAAIDAMHVSGPDTPMNVTLERCP